MRPRQGFTLLEILLVLAVLVLAVAIAIPVMNSMYAGARVRAAADAVKGALLQARTRAIEESRPYRVGIHPGGVAFRIAPDDESYWSGGSGMGAAPEGMSAGFVFADNLLGGVRFPGGQETSDGGTNRPSDPPASEIAASAFQTLAVFEPDGSCEQDITLTLRLHTTRGLVLTLRGMTGVASVKPEDTQTPQGPGK